MLLRPHHLLFHLQQQEQERQDRQQESGSEWKDNSEEIHVRTLVKERDVSIISSSFKDLLKPVLGLFGKKKILHNPERLQEATKSLGPQRILKSSKIPGVLKNPEKLQEAPGSSRKLRNPWDLKES